MGKIHIPVKERGVATLAMSLVLLFLITIATFAVSRSIMVEQKASNNDIRSRLAFEAGEAGLAAAIEYLAEDPDRDNDGVIDPVFDSNADNIGDTSTASVDTGFVTVSTTDLSGGSMTRIRIETTGFSDDASATRRISQISNKLDPLPNVPDNPFIARNGVVINGSATVTNPEGNSTIWSGSDVDLGSNNSTATEIADPDDPTYPGCMDTSMSCSTIPSSNKLTVGVDVVEHDTSLKNLAEDETFENFFGTPPERFRVSMVTIDSTADTANTDIQTATNEVVWVEGDTTFTNNTTVGCEVAVAGGNVCPDANLGPSIVIINGDLTMRGTPHLYGLIYVNGSINVTGNSTVYGSLIANGTITNSTGGSLDITYNSDILERTRANGPLGAASGTWTDFL